MRANWFQRNGLVAAMGMMMALTVHGAADPRMYQTPAEPVGRTEGWWLARHQAVLDRLSEPVDVVLLGDSITQNYEKTYDGTHGSIAENFQPIWQQYYAPRHAVNEGFSGDTTSNVLWRIAHGELNGIHPKLVILLIGTNNTDMDSSDPKTRYERTLSGVEAVVTAVRAKLPSTRILLVGILPSERPPEKTEADREVNETLKAKFNGNRGVVFCDVGGIFLEPDRRTLKTALFYDPGLTPPGGALHPNTEGQQRMAEAIEPTVSRLLNEPEIGQAGSPDRHSGTSQP